MSGYVNNPNCLDGKIQLYNFTFGEFPVSCFLLVDALLDPVFLSIIIDGIKNITIHIFQNNSLKVF